MRFVASILTMLFVASASASKSIYGGNVQASSSEKQTPRRRVLIRRQLVDQY